MLCALDSNPLPKTRFSGCPEGKEGDAMTRRQADETEDQRALYDLVLRYARAIDRRDYAAFGEIFAEDGSLAGYRGDPATTDSLFHYQGLAVIQERLPGIERYERTFHLVGNALFDVAGDEARGATYCTAHHIYRRADAPWNRTMAIRYQDRFVRRDGHWLLLERALWIDFESDAPLGDEGWA